MGHNICKLGAIFAIVLCTVVSLGAPVNAAIPKAHKTTHHITMQSLDGSSGSCSATAVGKHAILTATHCLLPADLLRVDNAFARVSEVMSDSVDHSILLLRGIEFADYAEIAFGNVLEQGEDIFLFGNPADYHDMFRKGYVAGFEQDDNVSLADLLAGRAAPRSTVRVVLFDFNGFFGDSGSALFNHEGRVVGVTSFITGVSGHGFSTRYMGAYDLRFTPRQIKAALEF